MTQLSDQSTDWRMGRRSPRLRRLTAAAWRANAGRIRRRLKGHNPKGNQSSRELRRSW